MKVHFTGRQVEITSAIRSRVEQKLRKIHKILGSHLDLEAHVILSLERHRYTCEVTLNLKHHPPRGTLVEARLSGVIAGGAGKVGKAGCQVQEPREGAQAAARSLPEKSAASLWRPVASLKKALRISGGRRVLPSEF